MRLVSITTRPPNRWSPDQIAYRHQEGTNIMHFDLSLQRYHKTEAWTQLQTILARPALTRSARHHSPGDPAFIVGSLKNPLLKRD